MFAEHANNAAYKPPVSQASKSLLKQSVFKH